MAYRQPGVTVTENFTGITPALSLFSLTNINIGPAFQVVSAQSAGSYTGSAATYNYPGQIAGTLVDTRAADPTDLVSYPVSISLSNVVVAYLTETTGSVTAGVLNTFNDVTTNIFANAMPGDVIVVTGSANGNNGSYTVRIVNSVNSLQTNETFTAAETGLHYTIRRNLQATDGNISIPSSTTGLTVTQANFGLPNGLTVTDTVLGSLAVLSATVLVSYRAQRLELSAEAMEFNTTQDLQAAFGTDQIVPQNPLAFAAFLALNNQTTSTFVLALDFQYLSNELLSYSDAFSILENEDMYALNVLTQNTSVATALNAHVLAMSEPTAKLERVGISSVKLFTTAVVVPAGAADGVVGTTPFTAFSSASGLFLTDGVVPGMFVNITAPTNAVGRYKIASVNSQTSITLAAGPTVTASGAAFFVDKNLTLDDQATFLAAYASSIGSRRLVVTWPDIVNIPNGPNVVPLPGYFLGAGLGALTTALPTQQGFTNQNMAVYQGVVHSTKYFTNAQLNTIAGGGVMIFVQNVLNVSALYIRHQLTTDTSAIKFQEFSITKNVDFIAKFIRNNHAQFPGKYNIVDTAFDDLKTSAAGIVSYLRDNTKLPKIGGVIKSGKLLSAIQDPANIDGIIEQWSLDIPIPLNNLDITINV
jgi:hypothetical protein